MDQQSTDPLVTQACQGDQQAFAALYRLWVGKIYAYCVVRVGVRQEAEDITERVFMKALKSIRTFKQQSSFATWIYTIARNELFDFYRKKHLQPIVVADLDQIGNQSQFNNEQAAQGIMTQVNQILEKLPDDYQQVLKLRFLQNMSVKDTAAVLGISENNVKVRQFRALKKARELYV